MKIAGYRVVFEEGPRNWSAYSPDLPGCIATGATRAATERTMASAIQFHLEGLARQRDNGEARPSARGSTARTRTPA